VAGNISDNGPKIVAGSFRSLDLGRFSYERITAGAPLKELNVV